MLTDAPYVEVGPCYSDGVKYDVIEGQSASFTCQIEANPEALLLWWYSKSGSTGIETLVDGPTARTTLSVTGVTRNMTSTLYGCETNNTEGVSARRYCQLNVLCMLNDCVFIHQNSTVVLFRYRITVFVRSDRQPVNQPGSPASSQRG